MWWQSGQPVARCNRRPLCRSGSTKPGGFETNTFQVPSFLAPKREDGIDCVAVGAGHPGRVRAQVGCGAVAWQNVRGHADQGPPLLQVHAAGNGPEKGQSCHLFPASEQL